MVSNRALYAVLFLASLVFTARTIQGQSLRFTKDEAMEDFQWLRFALEYVHPRLYKYDGMETVNARFDSLVGQITGDISGLDFLALVSKTNAAVRCGHLYTIPQGRLAREVQDKKVLPFHIKILEGKMYILNNCSKASIRNGSEILAINGKSAREIIDAIMPGIASDGYIQTRKFRVMERYFFNLFHGFDLYYQLYVDRSDVFEIAYAEYETDKKKTVMTKGMSIEERTKILQEKYSLDERAWFKKPSPTFKLTEQDDLAILTVSRSFFDRNVDPNFDSLLSSAFGQIRDKDIGNLILDLRNNEGGDERQEMELISYLYDKPFKLYQNIYLSHLDFRPLKEVVMERDTSALLFDNSDEYMRRINDNLWINNYAYSDNLKLRLPKENVFTGQLYVLTNGITFSSAADLAANLKKTTRAIFIGEETGGAYEGPTGGGSIVIQLPNSKIMVRISPNIQIGYMYKKHPIGRGVLPDYPIYYTIGDVLSGKDLEMETAMGLIKANK